LKVDHATKALAQSLLEATLVLFSVDELDLALAIQTAFLEIPINFRRRVQKEHGTLGLRAFEGAEHFADLAVLEVSGRGEFGPRGLGPQGLVHVALRVAELSKHKLILPELTLAVALRLKTLLVGTPPPFFVFGSELQQTLSVLLSLLPLSLVGVACS